METEEPGGGGGEGAAGPTVLQEFTWRTGSRTPPLDRTDPWPQRERNPEWRMRRAAASGRGSWKTGVVKVILSNILHM